MDNIPLNDRITEKDPFPYRLLQKIGVQSKKKASLYTLTIVVLLMIISIVLLSGSATPVSVEISPEEKTIVEQMESTL